jgi:hypothetical protein
MQVAVGDVVACVPDGGDVAWFGIIVRIFGPATKTKGKGSSDPYKYDNIGRLLLLCLFPDIHGLFDAKAFALYSERPFAC